MPDIYVLRSDLHIVLQKHAEEIKKYRDTLIEAIQSAQTEEERQQIQILFNLAGEECDRTNARGKEVSDLAPKMVPKLRAVWRKEVSDLAPNVVSKLRRAVK